MELTKEILEDIIKQFAEEGKIFSNEAQFQFELAWALREYKDKKGNKLFSDINDKIMLEHLSTVENEKMYTDIVVRVGKKYYPIELKYKTADKTIEYQKGNIVKITYLQGAHDDASYDFLKDIKRLEQIVIDKEFTPFDGEESYCVKKGFAIIISNEPKIWGDGVRDISKSPWHDFFLFSFDKSNHNTDRVGIMGKLGWNKKGENSWLNEEGNDDSRGGRAKPIILNHSYSMKWEPYMESEKPFDTFTKGGFKEIKYGKTRKAHPIKYVVVEVKETE